MRPEPVVVHAQRGPDGHGHVEVLRGAQAAAEKDAWLAPGRFPVGQPAGPGLRRIDRGGRLIATVGEARVLTLDHCLVLRVPVALRMEMAELVDAGEWDVLVRVVHDGSALEVPGRENLHVEVE